MGGKSASPCLRLAYVPLDLPKGVVEAETRELLRDYAENLAHQGIDVDKVELDWNKMAEEARPRAEGRVHSRLVLDAVASSLEIEVESSVVDERVSLLARAQGKSVAVVRREMTAAQLEALSQQLKREKALGSLLETPTPETEGED